MKLSDTCIQIWLICFFNHTLDYCSCVDEVYCLEPMSVLLLLLGHQPWMVLQLTGLPKTCIGRTEVKLVYVRFTRFLAADVFTFYERVNGLLRFWRAAWSLFELKRPVLIYRPTFDTSSTVRILGYMNHLNLPGNTRWRLIANRIFQCLQASVFRREHNAHWTSRYDLNLAL